MADILHRTDFMMDIFLTLATEPTSAIIILHTIGVPITIHSFMIAITFMIPGFVDHLLWRTELASVDFIIPLDFLVRVLDTLLSSMDTWPREKFLVVQEILEVQEALVAAEVLDHQEARPQIIHLLQQLQSMDGE